MTDKADNKEAMAEINEKINSFPVLPAMCQGLMKCLNNPNTDFGALAEEMRYDPGMTANVLKLANSAYFGAQGEIDSLQSAIVRLGLLHLFQLVVATEMSGMLKTELVGYRLPADELLRHSICVAVASEEFAKALNVNAPDVLFTAGLLHDVGKLVLDELVEGEQQNLIDTVFSADSEKSFEEIERSVFGMDHAEAGAKVLEKWNLPDVLTTAVRWHHEPERAEGVKDVVNMVHLADMLAYNEGIGAGIEGLNYRASEEAISSLGIKTSTLEYVACETLGKMEQLNDLLNIG